MIPLAVIAVMTAVIAVVMTVFRRRRPQRSKLADYRALDTRSTNERVFRIVTGRRL
ncbi:MAG: hypothetical protein ACREB0_00180 [Sphingopyxis sp.]